MPADQQYFIVACHGWSASNWVAYALNRHPQIACAHSSAAILATDAAVFDDVRLRHHIPRLRAGYLQRQTRPVTAVYRELGRQKDAAHIGSVHTYRLRDLPAQAELLAGQGRTFPVVNLVRHPLDLVISGYGQFQDLFRIDLNEFSWTLRKIVDQGLDIAETVCARHRIDPGAYDTVCFLGACVVLGSLRQDLDALAQIETTPDTPWDFRGSMRMEDVTCSPKTFTDLLIRLTDTPALATPDYLKEVFRENKINVHNRGAAGATEKRWRDLADWQREAFVAFLHRFAVRPAYEKLGYAFGFLEDSDG